MMYELLPAFVLAALATVLVSLLTPEPEDLESRLADLEST
jgi:Na+/proline symporter